MGRTYAGVLGPISFVVIVVRSLIDGDSVDSTLLAASLALFVFAAIGYVIGSIADKTVIQAIEFQFHSRLRAEESAENAAKRSTVDKSTAN